MRRMFTYSRWGVRPRDLVSGMRWGTLSRILAGILPGILLVLGGGCFVSYQKHHQTELLRLYHNSDHPPHGLDPVWAERSLRILAAEFGVRLEDITPVDAYINCDRDSRKPSRFNRLTKSIVLKVGQASLSRLYMHEITHLILDRISSSPPYWVDQGVAEYMESRCGMSSLGQEEFLLPAALERGEKELERIGRATVREVQEHLERKAIDQGRGWATPFIHYLLRYRWAGWSFPSQIRRLAELGDRDVEQLARPVIDFYASFDRGDDFLRQYFESGPEMRLALLGERRWSFGRDATRILEKIHAVEKDPALERLVAGELLVVAEAQDVGPTFERVVGTLYPDPLPDLDHAGAEALARYLVDTLEMTPSDWRFPTVARFLARRETSRTPVPLDTTLEWIERWPHQMEEFMRRRDVQEHFLPRLARLGTSRLELLLASTPLVDFRFSGVFSPSGGSAVEATESPAGPGSGATSREVGRLWLENRVLHLARLEAGERDRLKADLRRVLVDRSRREENRLARARAAVLLAYLGDELDLDRVSSLAHARLPAGEDVMAFACAFLLPPERQAVIRHLDWLLRRSPDLEGSAGGDRFPGSPLALFAPQLGLEGYREIYRRVLRRAAEPARSRYLAAAAAFRDGSLAAREVERLLDRREISLAARVFIQLAAGIDCGLMVHVAPDSFSVRRAPAFDRGLPDSAEIRDGWERWKRSRVGGAAPSPSVP